MEYGAPYGTDIIPSVHAIWYPFFIFTSTSIACDILQFFLHIIPGYIFDVIAIVTGRKERFLRNKGTKIFSVINFLIVDCQKFIKKHMKPWTVSDISQPINGRSSMITQRVYGNV